jgi:SAM-dependent methyltransferase
MTDDSSPAWVTGMQRLEVLQRAAEVLAALRAAERAGLLKLLVSPSTAADLSARLPRTPPDRVDAVLGLLAAHGIVSDDGGKWSLTSAWGPMVDGHSPVLFAATLGLGKVRTALFEASLDDGTDYWQLASDDRVTVATGVSPDPGVAETVAMARRDIEMLDGLTDALDHGGRALELGCGAGSRMCALVQAFPTATAVGVELAGDVAAFGRRRAELLGLAGRVRYVVGDAAMYEPDGLFDLVSWSQFFFPAPTRQGALATARRALRPGGWITMPVIWDGTPAERGSSEHQDLAAEALLLNLWNVPLRTAAEVMAEVTEAGFVDVRIDETPMVHVVRGRQPGG